MSTELSVSLVELLQKDRSSPNPRYPDQATFALRDERVSKTVEDRLQNGQPLTEVRLLEYNAAAGLNQVACLFSRPGPIALGCEGILVLMTADCKVVGLIDPFDLVQPNPYLPPLQKAGELPFAVARPSAVDGLA